MKKFPTFWERVLSSFLIGLTIIIIVSVLFGTLYADLLITDWILEKLSWDREIGAVIALALVVTEFAMIWGFCDPVNLRSEEESLKLNIKK